VLLVPAGNALSLPGDAYSLAAHLAAALGAAPSVVIMRALLRWTLRNVVQRFGTIVDVANAIVRRQHHFLEYGAMAMKPLGLREIADEVGVHQSTVSRASRTTSTWRRRTAC